MIRLICLFLFGLVTFNSVALGQTNASCNSLNDLIKSTYNFKPSKLSEAQQTAKSNEMDKVWNTVKANPKELLPCLREALRKKDADSWFLFDGAELLLSLDPSPDSKAFEAGMLNKTDLADVDPLIFVSEVTRRSLDGYDMSEAGSHWLTDPKIKYYLPQHAGQEVNSATGALFIYGSMDEDQATPALLKVINQKDHPGRETALWLLTMQATPKSLSALKQIDLTGFSSRAQKGVRDALEKPDLLKPRSNPKTTREEFLKAFQGIVNGNSRDFIDLVDKVHDGEKDVVAVMKPEDLPLIRCVRRVMISAGNLHVVDYYNTFTQILMTMVWKPNLESGF